jgi:hypothetical protein
VTRLRLGAKAPCDRIQEAAHEGHVRVADVQLLFDPVDGLDQIFLITSGKRHARDGMMYGN